MIQSVEIENFLGEHVECVLNDPFGHGLNITNITGLGPESINLNTQELALIDGSVYSTQRKSQRNIVITYKFIEAPDIEAVRHRTYDLFGLGRWVKLTFNTDHRSLWIEGFVESNEPDIFVDGETASISIVCPDPWFRSYVAQRSQMAKDALRSSCGFEFITDYGHEYEDRICFSESATALPDGYFAISNEGDRDVGVVMRLVAKEATTLSHIYIANTTTKDSMMLQAAKYQTLNVDDFYQVNTIPGYKMVNIYKKTPDGTGYSITPALNEIQRDLGWITLQKGLNIISVAVKDSGANGAFNAEGSKNVTDKFELTITHEPLYEGV